MLRRLASLVLVAWVLGFVLFAVTLPRPAQDEPSEAVVVLTGGEGRIARGIEVLAQGQARQMLVSGVDPEVKPQEFVAEYKVEPRLMRCCIRLGYDSIDTRSNARETAAFVREKGLRRIRLVTSDWHMRRAAWELRRTLPKDTVIIEDAVPSRPSLRILLSEYSKFLARLLWHVGTA
jgi:uncharacterized SAM-binding protein YcdF (DUF218 family)